MKLQKSFKIYKKIINLFLKFDAYRTLEHGPNNDDHLNQGKNEINKWKLNCPLIKLENTIKKTN